jgi:hypothetical protein
MTRPCKITFQVHLVGEASDDAGGAYNESISEMCDELHDGLVPLLKPLTAGEDTDAMGVYVFNSGNVVGVL